MLESAAKRRAWFALVGVTAAEAMALIWSFWGASWPRIAHFALTPPGTALAWACAAVFSVLYIAYSMFGISFIGARALRPQAWRDAVGLKLFAVPMAAVTGFFEEAFFRKTLMDIALHHGAGVPAQIAISAIVFGIAHGVWALLGGIRAGMGAVLATTVFGVALAGVYILGGRSLLPCAAAHIAINLVIEPWLVLAATSGNWGRSRNTAER